MLATNFRNSPSPTRTSVRKPNMFSIQRWFTDHLPCPPNYTPYSYSRSDIHVEIKMESTFDATVFVPSKNVSRTVVLGSEHGFMSSLQKRCSNNVLVVVRAQTFQLPLLSGDHGIKSNASLSDATNTHTFRPRERPSVCDHRSYVVFTC